MRTAPLPTLLCLLLFASGCNLFGSTTASPTDDAGVADDGGTASDATSLADTTTEADTGNNTTGDACSPESNADFCARVDIECGGASGTDNCGDERIDVPCGTCAADEACSVDGRCGCEPESDAAMCDRLVINCGQYQGEDNCGATRTVDCGGCTAPATCGGGGTDNVCACDSQTDQDFCTSFGAECGPVTEIDECGQMRTVNCGSCTLPETCGGAGLSNTCGCPPESDAVFCARVGGCGIVTDTDNCGQARSADCGGCPIGEQCSANNVCECAPEGDAAFCARLNGCGSLTAVDNCQATRTVDCGACSDGSACTNNQCQCVPEDDATFCARFGAECDDYSGTDNCGDPRTASCGSCSVSNETCQSNVCAPAFPPAGIDVWLRSDSGLTLSMQGEITEWIDRVSGEVWVAPTIPNRPTFVAAALNGHDTIRFFGGQRVVRPNNAATDTPTLTVFVVAKRAVTDREGPIVAASDATVGDTEFAYGTTADTMRFADTAAGLSFSATVLPTTTAQILTFMSDGSTFRMFQDGTETASTAFTATANFKIDAVGALHTQRFMRADLYEILIWPRALTDAERGSVRAYLTNRYGL